MKLVFCLTILTSLLYFHSLSPFFSPPFSNSWTIFALFFSASNSVICSFLTWHFSLSFTPELTLFALRLPLLRCFPPTFISFSSVRGTLVLSAQHQSLRDSLHLNTWKNLLIMTLDFGGIRRHNQTEWKIHEVSHTHMIMNIRTWGEHQSIEYLKWKEHVLYLGLKCSKKLTNTQFCMNVFTVRSSWLLI